MALLWSLFKKPKLNYFYSFIYNCLLRVHFKLSRVGGDTNPGRRAVGGVFTAHFQRDDATY